MAPAKPRTSLRTLLIAINLVVLLLPLAGIQLMRLYESALVRQTESALIAQGAFVAAFYRSIIAQQDTQDWTDMSRKIPADSPLAQQGQQWLPQPPVLDLASSPTLPPFPDGRDGASAEAFARDAGVRLIPVLKDAQLVTLAGIRVVDPWGVIIASTGEDVGLAIGHSEEVKEALAGRPASRLRNKTDVARVSTLDSISRTSSVRVFVANPIVMHGRLIGAVVLSRTPPSILQALYAKRWLLLQALVLLIALVVVMSLLTFRLIASPISKLADQAGEIARGELSVLAISERYETQKPRTKEIARLQQAITDMASTLEQRANYLQDFSRHVSHEFKTPIASIRGAIEVLQDHSEDMSEDQRLRFLSNIAADADRLHRLTQKLLELTKAEMGAQATQPFQLTTAISLATSGFADTLRIRTDGVDDEAQGLGNADVLSAVLETLFENAAQHDATELTLWTEQTPAAWVLHVQDNGSGISEGNSEQVFTPFFTTERDNGGTGLGLTIAQALMKQINGDIQLNAGNGPTVFTITLQKPLAA